MAHEPRLNLELRQLLQQCRLGALGTIDDEGRPFVSMVPWALEPSQPCLVLHVSALAAHARYLMARPQVSLLVMAPEQAGQPVHAQHRVSLQGLARLPSRDEAEWMRCRDVYLARFPEAEPMTQLGDFRFVALDIREARQVAGFGAARSLDGEAIRAVLQPQAATD